MSLGTKWFWVTADRLADLGTLVMDLWPPGQARAPEARRTAPGGRAFRPAQFLIVEGPP